MSMYTLAVACP